ncbi:MAG: hypothetical protein NT031_19655 [Planctomycetota bacterium]|nr:hypothetical protein [Planctomycetota bacterium]
MDFLPPEGGLALALAVETQRIQALLDCLGEAGIEVANIAPTSLLALGQYLSDQPPQARYLILPGPGGTDIFRMGHKPRPVAWFTAAPGAAAPLECLRADILASSLPQDAATVALLGEAPAELASAIAAEPGLTLVQGNDVPAFAAAARAAGDLIAGWPTGWVDLRRDKLEPPGAWKALTRLVSSAAILSLLLLAAVAACFHWRVKAYDALAARADQSQRDEYARLYPGRRVPVNAKIALASELKRLTGLQGADADSPRQSDALEALRTISAALPTTIRYRIVELRINPDDFLIEGQALDHTGAEVVAQGLVRAGYAVEPPRTEHLARGGVGFTLMAKSAPPKPAPGAAGGVK